MRHQWREHLNLADRRLCRALAVAIAGGGLLCSPAMAKDDLKIGAIPALTGVYAPAGTAIMRGVTFAVDEANAAGGIDGRKVVLQTLDTEGKADVSRRQAEKLVNSGFKIMTAVVTSGEALALMPLLSRWDAMLFVTSPKADQITGAECKPQVFRSSVNSFSDAATIREWIATRPEKKWMFIGSDMTFVHGAATLFEKTVADAGKTLIKKMFPAEGTTDYAPFIQEIKSSDADAVWVMIGGRSAMTFGQQAAQFGLTGTKTIGGIAFIEDEEARQLGKQVEGIYGIINYSATIDTPENKEFVEKWMKKHSTFPAKFEAETYMSMKILFEAVAATGSIEPPVLQKYIAGRTFKTVKGPAIVRAEDHQLFAPNFFGVVKRDGEIYRQVISSVVPADKLANPVNCKF